MSISSRVVAIIGLALLAVGVPITAGAADSTTPTVQISPSSVAANSQFTVSWTPSNLPVTAGQGILAYELCYGSGSGAVNNAQAIQIPASVTQTTLAAPSQVGVVSDIYLRAIYGTTGTTPSIAPCAAMVLLGSPAHATFTTVSASSVTTVPTISTNPGLPSDTPAPVVSRDPANGHIGTNNRLNLDQLKISWTATPASIDGGSLVNNGYFVCWGDFALKGTHENVADLILPKTRTSASLTVFAPYSIRQDVYVYATYGPPGTKETYATEPLQCHQLPKVAASNIGHTTYVVDPPPNYKPEHLGGCRTGTFSWTPNSIGTGGRGWGYFGNTDILVHVSATFYGAQVEFQYDAFPTGADVKTNLRSFHLIPGKNWFSTFIEAPNSYLEDNELLESFSISYSNCGKRPAGYNFPAVVNAPAFQPANSCQTKTVQFNWTSPPKKSLSYTTQPFNFTLGSWSPPKPNEPKSDYSDSWSANQLAGYTWREVLIQGSRGESMVAWSPPNDNGNGAATGNDWVKHVFLKVSNCPPNQADWVNTSGPKYWTAGRVDFWNVPAK